MTVLERLGIHHQNGDGRALEIGLALVAVTTMSPGWLSAAGWTSACWAKADVASASERAAADAAATKLFIWPDPLADALCARLGAPNQPRCRFGDGFRPGMSRLQQIIAG
jgi:hypothetical protein